MLFLWSFLFHYFILVFAKAFLRAFSGFWRAFNNLQWISICPISWLLSLRITDQINRKLAFFRFIIPRISKIKLYFATDFSQVWFVFDTLVCSSSSAEGYEDCLEAQQNGYIQYIPFSSYETLTDSILQTLTALWTAISQAFSLQRKSVYRRPIQETAHKWLMHFHRDVGQRNDHFCNPFRFCEAKMRFNGMTTAEL